MKFFNSLRRRDARSGHPSPHITWQTSSMGRSISRAGLFMKKQLWVWPILAVVLLSIIGLFVRESIETTMREGLESELNTLVNVETAMLETWCRSQKSNAESAANSAQVRQTIYQMLDSADETPSGEESDQEPSDDALQKQLDKLLGPALTAHDYVGYFVADKNKQILAASYRELVGEREIAEYDAFVTSALDGATNISAPFASVVSMKDEKGRLRTHIPTMFVCAPIRDESFQVVAVLALRMRPEQEFSRILGLGRIGDSGETYAFDKRGRMVSRSRFEEDLILLGLIPDLEESTSVLQLLVRDPGGDMTAGFHPNVRRRDLPLTHMASEAIAGRDGVNVEGYRDYRGVPVVGAWRWVPDANVGVATEIDYAEAYRPLTILRWTFWGLFVLLALSAAAIFVFTIILARLRREAQKAAIEAQQIGQYTLEKKLGSGGMGVVYKGHHAMLRRPTAIKLLEPDKVNPAALERFEREVQITSQLNNPSTIAIYDYGRTPEGVFYYAMEYLDGIDLQTLVERYGPQPVPRVIHILLQVCGSLYEAHSLGLVHRDIKPANIMLSRRGGEPDVAKVLDFGLVKALDEQKQAGLTREGSLTGTPFYMSPEAIQFPNSVDGRSDLYALGAVGYFLLTAKPVFEAESIVDLCQKHVAATPVPPSERLGTPIPEALESALLACLEKTRAKRPQTARELALLIGRCAEASAWSIEAADEWWGRHERGQATDAPALAGPTAAPTIRSNYAETIDRR
jgi:eukaryotic-like serine/threonine-protein kinase